MVKYPKPIQRKFSALSEPTRFALLARLLDGNELPLTALFKPHEKEMTLQGVLKHVRILEDAKLVTSKKVGRERRYTANQAGIHEFRTWLQASRLFFDPAFDRLKTHLESEENK